MCNNLLQTHNLWVLSVSASPCRVTIQINYNLKVAECTHTHTLPLSLYSIVWCWNLSRYTIYTSPLELLSWQHIRVSLLCYQNVYLLISRLFSGGKIGIKHVNNICPVNLLERLNFIITTQLLQKVMRVPWLTSLNPTLLSRGLVHTLCPISANS